MWGLTKEQLDQLYEWSSEDRVWITVSHRQDDLPTWTNDQFSVAHELIRLARIGLKSETNTKRK